MKNSPIQNKILLSTAIAVFAGMIGSGVVSFCAGMYYQREYRILPTIPHTNMKKELHTIRYSFTPYEIAQKSTQLAETCGDKSRLAEEKKSVMSDYKAKIDAKDSVIGLLSNHITNGYEIKSVECDVEYDFHAGLKRYFWQGELYDTRPMDDNDRQLEIS